MATAYARIDSTGALAGAQAFDKAVNQVVGGADRMATSLKDRLGGAFQSVRDSVFSVQGAFAALGGGFAIKEALKAADTYQLLQARIGMFAPAGENAKDIFSSLEEAAKRAQTPVLEFADVYQRNTKALQGLGFSTGDQIRLTETLAKAMKISGTSSEDATRGLIQLSQAFNLGILQGQDYKSIVEQMPAAMQILQAQTGKTAGQLKSLSEQGVLSAKIAVQAWLQGSQDIDAQMSRVPVTVGAAMSQMVGAVTLAFDKAAERAGVTDKWAAAFKNLQTTLDSPDGRRGMEVIAAGLAAIGEAAASAVKFVTGFATGVSTAFGAAKWQREFNDLIDELNGVDEGFRTMASAADGAAEAVAKAAKAAQAAAEAGKLSPFSTTVAAASAGSVAFATPQILVQQGQQNALIQAEIDRRGDKIALLRTEMELTSTVTNLMKQQDPVLAGQLTAIINRRGELLKMKAASDLTKQIEDARLENDLAAAQATGETNVARALQNQLDIRKKITPEMRSAHPELAAQLEREVLITDELKRQQKVHDELQQSGERLTSTLTDGLLSATKEGKSFGQTVKDISASLLEMFLKISVLEPLVKAGGKSFSNTFQGTDFAGLFSGTAAETTGGAASGLLSGGLPGFMFADGGVLNSPAQFTSGGMAGVAGEAGPEAILPLRRSASGALGVVAAGGTSVPSVAAPVINVTVAGDATSGTVTQLRAAAGEIIKAAVAAVADENRRSASYLRR